MDSAPKLRSRRAYLTVGGIGGVLLLGIGAYLLLTLGKESTDDAQIESDVVALAPRVGGQIKTVHVKDNQIVHKGELLVEIDDAEYAARLSQAQAELATAQAQAQAADAQVLLSDANARGGLRSAQALLSGSSAAVSTAEAQISAAKAGIARAEAEARKSELDLTRATELFSAHAIPRERLDNAQVARDAAQAALAQARAALSSSEEARRGAQSRVAEAQGHVSQSTPVDAAIAVARAGAELAHARVAAAQAAARLAELQYSYAKITAPADGQISQLTAREGAMVQPGQPLGQLVPVLTYVVANFKETQLDRMRPGDPVEIEVDAFPGRTLQGKVESLSGGTGARFSLLPPDNASGNFVKVVQRVPVRIAWTEPPKLPLRAGLSAQVTAKVGR